MTKRDGLSIDLRTVVILLILVNVPLWALAFFTVGQVESSVEAKIADDFRAITRKNAQTMNYAINHLVAEVATLAITPSVKEIVRKQNSSYSGSAELIQKRINEIDRVVVDAPSEALFRPGAFKHGFTVSSPIRWSAFQRQAHYGDRPHGCCGSRQCQDRRLRPSRRGLVEGDFQRGGCGQRRDRGRHG